MTNSIEACKKNAARMAIDEFARDGYAYGIGSGSTIKYAVQFLETKVKQEGWRIRCVPTSFQARQLINSCGLPLTDLELDPVLDLGIDGADEVDESLNCIKGGGACLTQEKIVATAAKRFVVIADHTKESETLCTKWTRGIPIEVIPMAYAAVKRAVEARYGGVAELRMGVNKAGPLVTDNGNFVLDWSMVAACPYAGPRMHTPAKPLRPWTMSGPLYAGTNAATCYSPALRINRRDSADSSEDPDLTVIGTAHWARLHVEIKCIPGVLETGLFVGMAHAAFFGSDDGTVHVRRRPSDFVMSEH